MKPIPHVSAVALVAAAWMVAPPPALLAAPPTRVGGIVVHEVVKGDTLRAISARYGADPRGIAADNALKNTTLRPGQRLQIDFRHIVPPGVEPGTITVNVPQRMLFFGRADDIAAFPVAAGKSTWRTPLKPFVIRTRETDPSWEVPPSIQEEARRQGRTLPAVVPPGPDNPLGKFWLGLSIGDVGIHGTNAPSSIYGTVTHGCIRMRPDDVAWLFEQVSVGTPGRIIYEPILLAADGDDVLLEVHPDVYGRVPSMVAAARSLAEAAGLSDRIDWTIAERVLSAREGTPRIVTRRGVSVATR